MLQGKIGVAMARNARGSGAMEQALAAAAQLDAIYLDRPHNHSVEDILFTNNLAALIVLEKSGPRIHSAAGAFAYHPSMAAIRVQQLVRGSADNFVKAMKIQSGSRVLDCTLGLASDAAVAAFVVGETGRVVGLEASPLLHFVVAYGLVHYETKAPLLNAALRRIQTINILAEDYLQNCPPDSFDAVYFDPMFRRPVEGSVAMDALRPLSLNAPLPKETVELALQAAPRVVIKERSENLLAAYGCTEFCGGKYSRVKYGILRR